MEGEIRENDVMGHSACMLVLDLYQTDTGVSSHPFAAGISTEMLMAIPFSHFAMLHLTPTTPYIPSLAKPHAIHPSSGFSPSLVIHRSGILSISAVLPHTEIPFREHNRRSRPLLSITEHVKHVFDISCAVLVFHESHFNSLMKQGGGECAYRSVQKPQTGTSRIVPTTFHGFQVV